MGEFGDRLGKTSVYPKFSHVYYDLTEIISKDLMDELGEEILYHSHDAWLKISVWTIRVCLILFDDVDIDILKGFLLVILTVKCGLRSHGRCNTRGLHGMLQGSHYIT